MNRRARIAAVPALLFALAPASLLHAEDSAPAFAARDTVRAIVTRAMGEGRVLGMSVAIADGGRLVFAEGFGSVDIEGKLPARAETRYRVASVAKPITAVAVLQLAAEGKLTLDDAARDRCPAFARRPVDPTIRHLLTHQSGVRHTTDHEDTTTRGAVERLADAIAPIAGEALQFAPGEKYLYSSWGYVVLGCAIESVSGRRFEDLLADRVLEPAGMTSTVFDRPDFASPDFSPGYRVRDGAFQPSDVVDTRFKSPASGLISTAPDLVRFALALQSGALLPEAWRARMFEPQPLVDGTPSNHTLGWLRLLNADGSDLFIYGGSMEGTTALLLVDPQKGRVVAILANRERYVRELFPVMFRIKSAIAE